MIRAPEGASLSLDPEFTGVTPPPDGAWCAATTILRSGHDYGTPGAVNDRCPT